MWLAAREVGPFQRAAKAEDEQANCNKEENIEQDKEEDLTGWAGSKGGGASQRGQPIEALGIQLP